MSVTGGIEEEWRGPAGVRHDVRDFLRLWLPVHLAGCAAAWGLDAEALPMPATAPEDPRVDAYLAREPRAIDRWPLIAVTSGRRTQAGRDFADDGSVVLHAKYPIRVYSWVKDEGFDAAQDLRDWYGTAVGVTLMSHLDLGSSGRLQVDPATLVTDFSRVEPVKGDRFVAGSYVGFDLSATETLTDRLALPGEQPRDTVSSVIATGTALPPTPTIP